MTSPRRWLVISTVCKDARRLVMVSHKHNGHRNNTHCHPAVKDSSLEVDAS